MKLSPIERDHILKATEEIENNPENLWSEYWIYITENNKEYPFKQLVRKAYILATGILIKPDFFQSNDGYREYIAKKFSYPISFKVRDNISFFTESDILLLAQVAGNPYNSSNTNHKQIGEELKKTIFSKTNTWARALNLEGFEIKMDNSWQHSGYFTRYSWARIYRKGDKNKKVFFTVGVSGEESSLVYKLDCQYRSYNPANALTENEIKIFNRIVKPINPWMEVSLTEIAEYNWEILIQETKDFIESFIPLYDEVINSISDSDSTSSLPGSLNLKPAPKGIGKLPTQKKPSGFSSPPDYDGENKERLKIGELGESLVMVYEKAYLTYQGKANLADKICKVPDFEGYDILSFYPDGKEKYIEVKTTTGSVNRPFFWTWNEKLTMQQNPEKYVLYRLYNYDKTENSADFFILSGDISEHILEEPIQYRVYIK